MSPSELQLVEQRFRLKNSEQDGETDTTETNWLRSDLVQQPIELRGVTLIGMFLHIGTFHGHKTPFPVLAGG